MRYVQTPRGRALKLIRDARKRALKRGIPFTVDAETIEKKIAAGYCEATGVRFDLSPMGKGKLNPFAPSLDQRIAGLGYTPENTQVVVVIHNAARGAWGDAPVHAYVIAMAKQLGVTDEFLLKNLRKRSKGRR